MPLRPAWGFFALGASFGPFGVCAVVFGRVHGRKPQLDPSGRASGSAVMWRCLIANPSRRWRGLEFGREAPACAACARPWPLALGPRRRLVDLLAVRRSGGRDRPAACKASAEPSTSCLLALCLRSVDLTDTQVVTTSESLVASKAKKVNKVERNTPPSNVVNNVRGRHNTQGCSHTDAATPVQPCRGCRHRPPPPCGLSCRRRPWRRAVQACALGVRTPSTWVAADAGTESLGPRTTFGDAPTILGCPPPFPPPFAASGGVKRRRLKGAWPERGSKTGGRRERVKGENGRLKVGRGVPGGRGEGKEGPTRGVKGGRREY
jgi:hypothetical protein